jgi:serine/threonine-protein kinase
MASSMRATAEISPGTLVGDRYCVQRTLGYGSCGCTYLVYDKQEPTQAYVLKEFAPADNREAVIQKCYSLFEQEAEVLCKLKHPQIPQCFDVFEDGGRLFLVQEYIDGKTYCELLQERAAQDRVFSVEEVLKWLKDLLVVLDNIHSSRIIHRDISPDNIMLPNGGDVPVLIDFGVVKQVITQIGSQIGGETAASIRGTLVGKAGYSPPEQLRLGQCYPNSDLYSLAVTALVLLTGKHPNELCDGYSLKWQWRKFVRLNGSLARIFDKMLEEIPKDRYQTATEVLEALSAVSLQDDPLETPRPSYEETTAEFEIDENTDIWSEQDTLLARSQQQKSLSALREIKTGKKTLVQEKNGTSVQVGKDPSKLPSQRRQSPSRRRSRAASMGWLTVGVLISGSLVGGWALGSQSPKIAFVCNLLNNCANDDLPISIAKGENETNVASEQPVWESNSQQQSPKSDRNTNNSVTTSSTQPDTAAASNSDGQEKPQPYQKDLSEQIQREVENQVSQISPEGDRSETSQENTNPPAEQPQDTPKADTEANKKPEETKPDSTSEEKKPENNSQQTLEIPEKSPLASSEPDRASGKPNQIKNPTPSATPTNNSKPKPEVKPDNTAAPEVKPTPQNNGNVAVNTAEKPKTNSSAPRPAEKPQNPPSEPKKTGSAQTYQPGYWQPVARINPKSPFKVKIVNQTKDTIEYAVTTNEFPPRQLYANENTTLTYIPLDANLLINSLAQTDKEFASSLEFEVSAANNTITVTIRPGNGASAGDSTLNIDNKGAIYIF